MIGVDVCAGVVVEISTSWQKQAFPTKHGFQKDHSATFGRLQSDNCSVQISNFGFSPNPTLCLCTCFVYRAFCSRQAFSCFLQTYFRRKPPAPPAKSRSGFYKKIPLSLASRRLTWPMCASPTNIFQKITVSRTSGCNNSTKAFLSSAVCSACTSRVTKMWCISRTALCQTWQPK